MTVIQMKTALQQAEPFTAWADPTPLPSTLLDVPAFVAGMLPAELRPWAMDIADRMQVPLDFVAIPAMVAAGALVGSRLGIRPESRTDWTEVGNLWGCIVGPPGALKSPALAQALAPMRRLESQAMTQNAAALAEYARAEALNKLHRDAAEMEARKHLRAGGMDLAADVLAKVEDTEAPKLKRYMTSDATAEKLGEICSANPAGILVHRDELLTLFSDLDREEKAPARGFYLTGWGGRDGYTFDRIGRGTVRIDTVNLSVIGTTQPARFPKYLRESFKQHDDGMAQRLQLLTWPDFPKEWTSRDDYPDLDAKAAAFECYSRLATFDVAGVGAERDSFDDGTRIPFLRFAPEALDLFAEWRIDLERKVRGDELSPHFAAHLSKYRGLVPRLALVYHLASRGSGPVTLEAATAGLAWAEYLEAHAARAYASMSIANTDVANAIVRRIRKGDLKNGFTERDAYRQKWSGLTDRDQVCHGLKLLEDHDWLVSERVMTGGRPSTLWWINPAISQ